jgi:hypothetical protein
MEKKYWRMDENKLEHMFEMIRLLMIIKMILIKIMRKKKNLVSGRNSFHRTKE